MIRASTVDAILDEVDDEESPAHALADLLDDRGEWDWSDGAEHEPSDRMAVLESSGAYWLVYRGTEGDTADRYASADEAMVQMRATVSEIGGAW